MANNNTYVTCHTEGFYSPVYPHHPFPFGITLDKPLFVLYAMPTQLLYQSCKEFGPLFLTTLRSNRVCKHDLTVTLTLLCTLTHCVNETIYFWQLSEFPYDWFSVHPPLTYMHMCLWVWSYRAHVVRQSVNY